MLIIAQDFDDEVVQNLRLNHLQGNIKCCLVKAPSFGDYRKYVLEDLALLTNAKLATYDNGIELQKVDETMLGSCGKVVITKDSTTILNGNGNAEVIAQRVSEIKSYLSTLQSGEETLQKFHKERIARLVGGICSIKVGANSELEMREKKDRVDDAVCATRAACEEGIVPGGGLTFLKAFVSMPTSDDKDIQTGIDIVRNSLNSVFDKIVENAGENPQEIGQEVYPDENIS
jgi:chaperonin GroEL